MKISNRIVVVTVLVLVLLGGATWAWAQTDGQIKACVKGGKVTALGFADQVTCDEDKKEETLLWNIVGPAGPPGTTDWDDLQNVPPGIADGDDDTTYDAEITALSNQVAQLEARIAVLEAGCWGILVGTRWCDHGDGTVTDLTTGYVWLKNANCFGLKDWWAAISAADTLNSGECDLADGSLEGDWHLPTIDELESLVQGDERILASTPGPFTGVQSNYYWSSTTYANVTSNAWSVCMSGGYVGAINNSSAVYVWPVRGGP